MSDMDSAYANAAFIPGAEAYPDRWEIAARQWREVEHAVGRARLNVPYGPGVRNAYDLFYPAGRPTGLVVFIHGGYWRAFDRKAWSHLAAGATARGWAVAMPSYTLAPEVRIAEITAEIARAVAAAAEAVPGPVVLSGHSAGGHLAARMLCADVALPEAVAARLAGCVPISPVADLRPLLETAMNADLRLDAAEAVAESPALQKKARDVPVTVWVGAEERPAFLDQARGLAAAWPGTALRIAPGRHHFDVIDLLEEPDGPLVETLVGGWTGCAER